MPKNYGDMEYQASTRLILSGTGTDALPGFTFAGDLNTGIYTPGADQIGFSTNGTLRFTINSEGALLFADTTAPGVTTNKLYSVGGVLTWNGSAIGGGLQDVVDDTTPQLGGTLEVNGNPIVSADVSTAANSGNVLIGSGDASYTGGGYTSGTIQLQTGAGTNGNNVGPIRLYGGASDAAGGYGGYVGIYAGNNTGSYGYGGEVTIAGGNGNNTDGYGGNVTIVGGGGSGYPGFSAGNISLQAGTANGTYAGGGYAGYINIKAGTGDGDNHAGFVRIQGGDSFGTGDGGGINLEVGGAANPGTGSTGDVVIRVRSSVTSNAPVKLIFESPEFASRRVSLSAPTGSWTARDWVLPVDDPAIAAGKFLTTDSSGVLSFAAGAAAVDFTTYTAIASQTTFTGADDNSNVLSYTAGFLDVYLNGVLLDGSQYTASNGTSVVLNVAATAGDTLQTTSYTATTFANSYTKAESDANFLRNIVEDVTPQLGANLDVNTFDINSSEDGGALSISSGSGISGNISGGGLTLSAGDGFGFGSGGDITITSGTTSGDVTASGGDIIITAGAGGSSVSGGDIFLTPGDGGGGTGIIINGQNSTTAGNIKLQEASTNGTDYIELVSPTSVTTSRAWTLPQDAPVDGQIIQTDGSGVLSFTGNAAGRSNIIINGSMRIWQRGVTFAAAVSNKYQADRWNISYATSAVGTVQRTQASGLNVPFDVYWEYDVTTADTSIAAGDYLVLQQPIEGYNVEQLKFGKTGAKDITVSFWHAHTVTGTYSVAFRNSGSTRSYVAEYTQTNSDSFEQSFITIPGDVAGTWLYGSGTGLAVSFCFMSGSTFATASTDTWLASNKIASTNQVNGVSSTSNFLRISNVQVEAGSEATEYDHISFDGDYASCLRYYEKSFILNTAPADGAINASSSPNGYGLSTTTLYISNIHYSVIKRGTPTLTFYRTSGEGVTNGQWASWNGSAWVSATITVGYRSTSVGFKTRLTTTGLTVGDGRLVSGHWTSESEL